MNINVIEPFIPSGPDFAAAKEFFRAMGFATVWENGDYAGFACGGGRFILQKFDDQHFAENLMMRVAVGDLDEFWRETSALDLPARFGVKLNEPKTFPWGREATLIDLAGVCWHFTEGK